MDLLLKKFGWRKEKKTIVYRKWGWKERKETAAVQSNVWALQYQVGSAFQIDVLQHLKRWKEFARLPSSMTYMLISKNYSYGWNEWHVKNEHWNKMIADNGLLSLCVSVYEWWCFCAMPMPICSHLNGIVLGKNCLQFLSSYVSAHFIFFGYISKCQKNMDPFSKRRTHCSVHRQIFAE